MPSWGLILILVKYSCELGHIMTRYDFLEARWVIWSNVWTDFWQIFCSQKVNYIWRSYQADRPLVLRNNILIYFLWRIWDCTHSTPPPPPHVKCWSRPPATRITHDHRWMTIWGVFCIGGAWPSDWVLGLQKIVIHNKFICGARVQTSHFQGECLQGLKALMSKPRYTYDHLYIFILSS